MTVRLGNDHRLTPAPRSDFGPPDPPPGCPECGATVAGGRVARHDVDCPLNPYAEEWRQ